MRTLWAGPVVLRGSLSLAPQDDGGDIRYLGASAWNRTTGKAKFLKRLGLRFEGFFRLNRKADCDVGGTVELLEHLVAKQAAILTLSAGPGSQLDAAITGVAGRTGEI
jgi:hypothetical protein